MSWRSVVVMIVMAVVMSAVGVRVVAGWIDFATISASVGTGSVTIDWSVVSARSFECRIGYRYWSEDDSWPVGVDPRVGVGSNRTLNSVYTEWKDTSECPRSLADAQGLEDLVVVGLVEGKTYYMQVTQIFVGSSSAYKFFVPGGGNPITDSWATGTEGSPGDTVFSFMTEEGEPPVPWESFKVEGVDILGTMSIRASYAGGRNEYDDGTSIDCKYGYRYWPVESWASTVDANPGSSLSLASAYTEVSGCEGGSGVMEAEVSSLVVGDRYAFQVVAVHEDDKEVFADGDGAGWGEDGDVGTSEEPGASVLVVTVPAALEPALEDGAVDPVLGMGEVTLSVSVNTSGRLSWSGCHLGAEDITVVGRTTIERVVSGLLDGQYTSCVVTLTNDEGSDSLAIPHWRVDATAPELNVDGVPDGVTAVVSSPVRVQLNERGHVEATCGVTGQQVELQAEEVGIYWTKAAEGEVTCVWTGVDEVGNERESSSYTWTVDGVAPGLTVTSATSTEDGVEIAISLGAEAYLFVGGDCARQELGLYDAGSGTLYLGELGGGVYRCVVEARDVVGRSAYAVAEFEVSGDPSVCGIVVSGWSACVAEVKAWDVPQGVVYAARWIGTRPLGGSGGVMQLRLTGEPAHCAGTALSPPMLASQGEDEELSGLVGGVVAWVRSSTCVGVVAELHAVVGGSLGPVVPLPEPEDADEIGPGLLAMLRELEASVGGSGLTAGERITISGVEFLELTLPGIGRLLDVAAVSRVLPEWYEGWGPRLDGIWDVPAGAAFVLLGLPTWGAALISLGFGVAVLSVVYLLIARRWPVGWTVFILVALVAWVLNEAAGGVAGRAWVAVALAIVSLPGLRGLADRWS